MQMIMLFLTAYVIAFSGAIMPGPLLTVNITRSASRGFIAGPLLIMGHAIPEMILITLVITGMGSFLENRIFIICISIIGGIVMAIMSVKMFFSLPRLSIKQTASGKEFKGGSLLAGAILSISNPYWIIWWATIGLGYLTSARALGLMGVVIFFTGHIMGDLTWYSFISALVAGGKKFFSDNTYKILVGSCALILIIFAILFIIKGIKLI